MRYRCGFAPDPLASGISARFAYLCPSPSGMRTGLFQTPISECGLRLQRQEGVFSRRGREYPSLVYQRLSGQERDLPLRLVADEGSRMGNSREHGIVRMCGFAPRSGRRMWTAPGLQKLLKG